MQQNFKRLQPLRWLGAMLLASALFSACESKETKTTKTTEATKEVKQDSMPALDTDSNSSTRPETIKN